MRSEWIEFIDSLKIMSKLCNDRIDYEVSTNLMNSFELTIIESDDILFSDHFEFTIFQNAIIFIYNNHIDTYSFTDFESGKNYIIEKIKLIYKVLDFGDYDDRLKIIKGKM